MYIKVALFLLLASVVVGVLLFVPLRWLAKRLIRYFPKSEYAKQLSGSNIFYSLLLGVIVVGLMAAPQLFPDSGVGKIGSSFHNNFLYFLVVIVLIQIVIRVWNYFAMSNFKKKINKVVNEYTIDPWSKAVVDASVNDEMAYCVECHNDDGTKVEFVLSIMMRCFGFDELSAARVVNEIHAGKSRKIGRMSHDDATELVEYISKQSHKYNFPFRCEVVAIESGAEMGAFCFYK